MTLYRVSVGMRNVSEMDPLHEPHHYDWEMQDCGTCWGAKGQYNWSQQCMEPCDECSGYGIVPDFNKPLKKKGKTMNYSSAVMLINNNIRAVKVTYEPDTERDTKQRYIYKTLDKSLQNGDYVVVPTDTRHNLTVCQVDEINVDVDPDDSTPLKWIVAKVDKAAYDSTLSEEAKWIEALKGAEKDARRKEMAEKMINKYGENLKNLPIANAQDANAMQALPAPTATKE